jgi:hypothetical protein
MISMSWMIYILASVIYILASVSQNTSYPGLVATANDGLNTGTSCAGQDTAMCSPPYPPGVLYHGTVSER